MPNNAVYGVLDGSYLAFVVITIHKQKRSHHVFIEKCSELLKPKGYQAGDHAACLDVLVEFWEVAR